mgnify:CR=1 FL=1
MTAFPGVPLQEPQVLVAELVNVDGPWLELRYTNDVAQLEEQTVFFAIQDADPSSPEEMATVTQSLHGDVVPLFRNRWRDYRYIETSGSQEVAFEAYAGEISMLSQTLGFSPISTEDLTPRRPKRQDPFSIPQRVHVAEVAGRIWMLRTLILAASGDIPVRDSGWHEQFPIIPSFVTAQEVHERSWLLLRPFSPYLIESPMGEPRQASVIQPTAIEVCALQLYNATVSEIGLTTCALCGRVFYRQRGRATHVDHHRQRASYCTNKCAQNAAQRASRARKRAERKEGE